MSRDQANSYLTDPQSVDESWRGFFAELGDDPQAFLREVEEPAWARRPAPKFGNGHADPAAPHDGAVAPTPDIRKAALDSIRAMNLIRAYRVRGHLIADLDPLGLERRTYHPDLDPATYGFIETDFDRPIFVNNSLGFSTASLREILDALRATYCGHVGIEYMHILELLTDAELLERFLDKRYTGTKRFGLEGGEALIPALEQVTKRGSQLGMKEMIIGMPHRGRLNVLANMMGKPFAALFSEFQGNPANPADVQGSGDVKNQIGFTTKPAAARSGPYSSELAKSIQAPIFHVNGDDAEAVVHVSRIATEFRYRFKKDVVVDMFCYRRYGHNETDEPAFTQPLMYRAIASHPTVRTIYAKRLADEGVIDAEEAERIAQDFNARLEAAFEAGVEI